MLGNSDAGVHTLKRMGFMLLSLSLVTFVAGGCDGEEAAPAEPGTPTSFDSTWGALQHHLFEEQGCTTSACHGASAAGELDLRADHAYDQLVEVPSVGSGVPPGGARRPGA